MTSTIPLHVGALLDEWLGPGWNATALAGDASVRAYYRVQRPDGSTAMLAWYPEEVRPQLQRFLATYEAISPVAALPPVIRHSEEAVLQEDAGDVTAFDMLFADPEEGIRLYSMAVDLIADLQKAVDPQVNPPFTAEFFRNELEMTLDYYVARLMEADRQAVTQLSKAFVKLCDSVARHPYRLCHRDYHGQNLHVIDGRILVIDYQDARPGPDTYDLASLLRDRGVARILGEENEERFIRRYAEAAQAPGDVRARYFETLLQRSLKILGTFSKQPIARGRMHYLEFIPPTLESVRRCLRELPQYEEIGRWLPVAFDVEQAAATASHLHAAESR
jgi:aminoglycoside/choline kinase family phosphotransferase